MIRLIFKKTWDKYEKGQDGFVERTLAERLCNDEYAIPYSVYLKERKNRIEVATSTVKVEKAVIKRAKKVKKAKK